MASSRSTSVTRLNTFYVGPYLITPHPEAPRFSSEKEASLLFKQVLSEVSSSNPQFNAELTSLVRQLSLTSLHFFLSCILGPFGPYDQLTDAVSLSMCNFRQSEAWEAPGAHAAAFIPRGFFKSTVFTTGGTTWDLLRNPSERAVIVNAISDKALEFFHQVQRNFDSNEFVKFLFPEYIPGKLGGKMTDKEMILPNRRGSTPEPSLRCLGLTGAAEGGHYSLITIDDLVGLDSIDQQRQSNATMETAKKWFRTNRRALRLNRSSRIGVVATRYALDDCYEDVYKNCKSITGWTKGDLVAKEGGEWAVYYRLVEEDDIYIKPHVMNKQEFEQLLQDDFWAAMTQYMNAPTKAGLAEFAEAILGKASLVWKDEQWWLQREPDYNFADEDERPREIPLASCDVVISTDLAATDSGINARTCRTSLGAWACDGYGNKYRFWSRVGFYSIHQSMEYLFEVNRLFRGYIRTTIIEANAFQKIVKPILEREMDSRKEYFPVLAVNAAGDKRARIRSALGQTISRKQLFLVEGAGKEFLEELRLFPMGNKVDCLDESEKGITYTSRPATIEERDAARYADEDRDAVSMNAVGY
jgi:hypothetical protein